jgi:hypothetical protein
MSANRLRNLSAIYLAALYGVVGLTGQSIHYFVTDGWSFWTTQGELDTGGYYHVHAPDFHGHYHRHANDADHSHRSGKGHSHSHIVATKPAGESILGVEFTSSDYSHQPHSCPALALVSTLKLSQAGGCLASLILDSVVAPTCEVRCIRAFEFALAHCPRGPPACSIA